MFVSLWKANLAPFLTSMFAWLHHSLWSFSIAIVVQGCKLCPGNHSFVRKMFLFWAVFSIMEWYTSILPVWQKSVSLARSFRSFVFRTTSSKAKWAGEPGLSQQVFFASDDEICLWPHWWNKVLPIHLCSLTIFSQKDHIAITGCCTPPKVIGIWSYPWHQFLATLLLCLIS